MKGYGYIRNLFGESVEDNQCSISTDSGMLVVETPYHPALVADLKALVPASERRWDAGRKAWLIDPKHGAALVRLVEKHFGETIELPRAQPVHATRETRLLEVRYLGATKDHGGDEFLAYAYIHPEQEWGVVFRESVLRAWFEADATPDQAATLYAVLAASRSATVEEIKAGYRRMAMQWHPDRCKEPGAQEQFLRVQEAYQILSDPNKRARYDAGLALQATLGRESKEISNGYRSPLRCGYILAEGTERFGRFWVEKILQWEDIYNSQGQMLIVSWPYGAIKPIERWV